MSAALLLVVFVSRADAGDVTSLALERAAEQVLGAAARVELRAYDAPPTDAELAAASPASEAVAEILWEDAPHKHATLRCYLSTEQRLITRDIRFGDGDAPAERGRLLGFALASLVPESSEARAPSEARPPPAAPSPRDSTQRESAPPASSAPAVSSAPLAPPHYYGAIDVVAQGATGDGGGLGAGIGARWFFHPALGLRFGLGVRRGEIRAARAFSDNKGAALGLTFRYTRDANAPLAFGGRADVLLMAHEVGRFPEQGGPAERSTRFVPGADLLLEAAWNVTSSASLLVHAGVEVSFSDDAVLHGQQLAELPPFRGVAELGARSRF